MIKLEFDFGVGETGTGEPVCPFIAEQGVDRLLHFVSAQVGGGSVIPRKGAWMGNGRLIIEPGYTLVVLTVSDDCIEAIVGFIKITFQQTAVFVTRTKVGATLY